MAEQDKPSKLKNLDAIITDLLEDDTVSKFKRKAFGLLQLFVPKRPPGTITAVAFIAVSFMQLLSLLLADDNAADEMYYSTFKYLRIVPLIISYNSVILYRIWLSFLTLLQIALFVCTCLAFFTRARVCASVCSRVSHPLFWLLPIPAVETLCSAWECSKNACISAHCWGALHIVELTLATLQGVLGLLLILPVTLAVSHSHVYSNDPFAHFPWSFEVVYAGARLVLATSTLSFWEKYLTVYYMQPVNLILAGYFMMLLWNTFPYYNPKVSLAFATSLIATTGTVTFEFIFLVFYNSTTQYKVCVVAVNYVLAFFLVKVLQPRRYYSVLVRKRELTPQETALKAYVLTAGLLRGEREEVIPVEFVRSVVEKALNVALDCSLAKGQSENSVGLIRVKKFVIDLLDNKDWANNIGLSMQLARAYLHMAENSQAVSLQLLKMQSMHPNILWEFEIFRLREDLQEYIAQSADPEYKKGPTHFSDVLLYELQYKAFCELLKTLGSAVLEFMNNVMLRPDFNVLYERGFEVLNKHHDVVKMWKKLAAVNPGNMEVASLYSSYLKNAMGYSAEAAALIKETRKQEFMLAQEIGERMSFTLTAVSIMVSFTKDKKTKILRASQNVSRLFGYARRGLVGKDLEILMPHTIAKNHGRFVKHHLTHGKHSNFEAIETFGIDINGYIFPLRVEAQEFFSLKYGLIYTGIMEKVQEESVEYLVTDGAGLIEGISKELSKILSLTPIMIVNEKKMIQEYCPDLKGKEYHSIEGQSKYTFVIPGYLESAKAKFNPGDSIILSKLDNYFLKSRNESARIQCYCIVENFTYGEEQVFMKAFKFPSIGRTEILDSAAEHRICISPEIREDDTKIGRSSCSYTPRANQFIDLARDKGGLAAEEKLLVSPEVSPRRGKEEVKVLESKDVTNTLDEASSAFELLKGSNMKGNAGEKVLRNEIQMTRNELAELNKKLARLKELKYSNFNSTTLKHLRLFVGGMLIVLLSFLLANMILSVMYNSMFYTIAKLILRNTERTAALGNIGQATYRLDLYNIRLTSGIPIIDLDLWNQFDTLIEDAGATTHQLYLLKIMEQNIESLIRTQYFVMENIDGFSKENRELVEPSSLLVVNEYQPAAGEYHDMYERVSFSESTLRVVSHAQRIVSMGDAVESNFLPSLSAGFILNTIFFMLADSNANAVTGLQNEFTHYQSIINNAATCLLIATGAILGIVALVIFPLIYVNYKDRVAAMQLFTQVSKADVKEQISSVAGFLHELRAHTNEKEEAAEEEAASLKKIEALNLEDAQETEDYKETDGLKKNKSSRKASAMVQYTPLRIPIWYIIILFLLFGGILIGLDFAYTTTIEKNIKTIFNQNREMHMLAHGVSFYSYNLVYLSLYILGNQTEVCSVEGCDRVKTSIAERVSNLAGIMSIHNQNQNILPAAYNELFDNIFENNPCETVEYFASVRNCSKALDGIYTQGQYSAAINALNQMASLKNDVDSQVLDIELIIAYLNDPRQRDLEILSAKFLQPACWMLCTSLLETTESLTSKNLRVSLWSFVGITLAVIILSLLGGCWLLSHIKLSMFYAAAVPGYLPPAFIRSNQLLLDHVRRQVV